MYRKKYYLIKVISYMVMTDDIQKMTICSLFAMEKLDAV